MTNAEEMNETKASASVGTRGNILTLILAGVEVLSLAGLEGVSFALSVWA